jgi:hypothetical protein
MILLAFMVSNALSEDKSSQIASWVKSMVNTGGYNGCQCKRLGAESIKPSQHSPKYETESLNCLTCIIYPSPEQRRAGGVEPLDRVA